MPGARLDKLLCLEPLTRDPVRAKNQAYRLPNCVDVAGLRARTRRGGRFECDRCIGGEAPDPK
jgi:hypothetical protein